MNGYSRSRVAMVMVCLAMGTSVERSLALRNVDVGEPIPPFSVKVVGDKALTNEAFQGQVLLVMFVRPAHRTSQALLKIAQEILDANQGAKLRVLAVSASQQAPAELEEFAKQQGVAYPIAADPQRKMYGDCGVLVVPTVLLIDEKSVLRYEQAHAPPGHAIRLRLHVDFLLGKITQEQLESRLSGVASRKSEAEVSHDRRLAMARVLVEDEKLEEAVALLRQVMADRASPRAAALLGDCYLRLDRIEEAAVCLERFAEHQPSPPSLKLALARLEIRRGDDERAENYLREALEVCPKKGRILLELGRLHERQGKPSEALSCYRRALEEVYGEVE